MRKKIQIRVPQRAPTLDLNSSWNNELAPAIRRIFVKDESLLSFDTLYDTIYKLVLQEQGKLLYERLENEFRNHLITRVRPNVDERPDAILASVSAIWKEYNLALRMVDGMFVYFNRSHCGNERSKGGNSRRLPSVLEMGRVLFAKEILSKQRRDCIYDQIVLQVNLERKGALIDTSVMRTLIKMLETLVDFKSDSIAEYDTNVVKESLFDVELQPQLKDTTVKFYESELTQLLTGDLTAHSILGHIQNWLSNEAVRGALYLPSLASEEILTALKEGVIACNLNKLWDLPSAVNSWFDEDDKDALRAAAELESSCASQNELGEAELQTGSGLISHVSQISAIKQLAINDSETGDGWIAKTLSLHSKVVALAAYICKTLAKSAVHESIIVTSHVSAMNQCRQMPEYLAQYLDGLLRKQGSSSSDVEIEEGLDNAITLFDTLEETDKFTLYFKRQLARRLLLNRSRSEDLEMSWLLRLKASERGGVQYVFEFQRMLKDIHISKEVNSRWRHEGQEESNTSTLKLPKINVNVLAKLVWPPSLLPADLANTVLPKELQQVADNFEKWYFGSHFRRCLDWNHGLGTVEVKINVAAGSYIASVPVVTMAILSIFHDDEPKTVEKVSQLSQVPLGGEIERHLKPLLVGRTNLLLKTPATPDINPEDILDFNVNFTSPVPRFKVQAVAARKTASNSDESGLEQERLQKAQAAVVRIMKARRELGHASLILETANLLARHFKATPYTIKRAIQALLDKEYLRRAADNQSYIYVA